MKLKRISSNVVLTASLTAISLAISNAAMASGYQVSNYFYNAVATGDAGAGEAALAPDASTAFSNPAGLVRIPTYQVVGAGSYLSVRSRFRGSNTWSTTALPPPFNTYTETGTANGGFTQFLPALHFSGPLMGCSNWRVGLSVAPIFGLKTLYNINSILRYNSTKSELEVVDISPVLAYAIDDHWSVGAGPDYIHGDAVFRVVAGVPSISTPPTANDVVSRNSGNGWALGWHAGAMYQLNPCTRVGLNYRSKATLDLHGQSTLSGGGFLALGDPYLNNTRVRFVLPATTTLSAYSSIGGGWALEGTVRYTQWSMVPGVLKIFNIAGPGNAPINAFFPWHYRNTWLFAVGANYEVTPCWLLRAGVHYDQSPIRSHERFPIIPDNNRTAVAVGTHYQVIKCIGLDAGWTHFFVKRANFSAPATVAIQTSTPNGYATNSVDIVSAQITWDIA